MPKNKFGGNRAKRGKNQLPKEFIKKEASEDQQYAKVTKILGGLRFNVLCLGDNKTRIAHVRGKLRKRAWVNLDSIVIISLRDYQDDKCDIIHTYNEDETHRLIKLGEIDEKITDIVKNNQTEECSFTFDEI